MIGLLISIAHATLAPITNSTTPRKLAQKIHLSNHGKLNLFNQT